MKHRIIKEIETTPLIISILLWYIKTVAEWLMKIGMISIAVIGIVLLANALDIPYWHVLIIIAGIAAADTGWIVYKAFKTNKLKRKKKGDKNESINERSRGGCTE